MEYSICRSVRRSRRWLSIVFFVLMGANVSFGQSLSLTESNETIKITQGDQIVLVYNKVSPPAPDGVDPVYERSGCLHPVNSPGGFTVTEMFPADHLHQHGIFSAWVRTTYGEQQIDFWNLAGRTGRVLHDRIVNVSPAGDSIGFEADLIHRIESSPPIDVLRERWKITANETDGTYHSFDLESTQSAITDVPLLVNEYHYGGIAFRGTTAWLVPKREDNDDTAPSSRFLNNLGSDRKKGNHEHARWVALSGKNGDNVACIIVLCHADNFRSPQAARLHPTKPYFCFAPCVDGEFAIDREHPYTARFRYIVTDSKPEPKWLDQQWEAWCGTKR